jgi:hypothetical protein
MVAALLLVQVLYKVTTPFTVGKRQNPVVVTHPDQLRLVEADDSTRRCPERSAILNISHAGRPA